MKIEYYNVKVILFGGDYMGVSNLTDAEAKNLIKMLKHSLVNEIMFPMKGETQEFDVIGNSKKNVFSINIFRGKKNALKYNICARIKRNGIMLIELHINPSNVHYNPDGQKIKGSHWHIYTEKYGRAIAFPAEDIESDKFVDNTIEFLIKFNVVDRPNILYQAELA